MTERETVRLQVFLAEAGIASRRGAEDWIRQGRVEVNGVVARIGTVVCPDRDRVTVDGEVISRPGVKLYLMMNKPRGVLCSASDPQGRRTAVSLLPALPVRVHSIGRLDLNSEGLLLFTNDGTLSRALMHPSSQVERVYHAKVQGPVPERILARLRQGVRLEDGPARCEVRILRRSVARPEPGRRRRATGTNTWVEVTLREGRYREVRRLFQAVGLFVLKLRRVRFGPVSLGRLPPGAVRPLTDAEVEALRGCVQAVRSRRKPERPPAPGSR